MSHNILITGASGYLGGSLLARWNQASLPPYQKLYALVRTDEQAKAVKELYGAESVQIDQSNESDIKQAIISRDISIIYWLISASEPRVPKIMIHALSEVKKHTGKDVHFIFTSGAKVFSGFTGHPTDRPLLDTDPELYEFQKTLDGPQPHLNKV
jgi:nucleoside-diphosphate-sugar epimerase